MESTKAKILENPHIIFEDEEIFQAVLDSAKLNQDGAHVVDIRSALIDRLNSKLGVVTERERSTYAAAHDFFDSLKKTHQTVLELLDAKSLNDFLDKSKSSIETNLEIDNFVIVMEQAEELTLKTLHPAFIVTPKGIANRYFADPSDPARPHIKLRLSNQDSPILVLDQPTSEAVISLNLGSNETCAFIILSALDLDRFAPDRATDLLDFFGKFYEKQLAQWLKA